MIILLIINYIIQIIAGIAGCVFLCYYSCRAVTNESIRSPLCANAYSLSSFFQELLPYQRESIDNDILLL